MAAKTKGHKGNGEAIFCLRSPPVGEGSTYVDIKRMLDIISYIENALMIGVCFLKDVYFD